MKKYYKIVVDCPSCAHMMESATSKTPGVKDTEVSFMMQKMMVEFEGGYDPRMVMKEVLANCRKYVKGCDIDF